MRETNVFKSADKATKRDISESNKHREQAVDAISVVEGFAVFYPEYDKNGRYTGIRSSLIGELPLDQLAEMGQALMSVAEELAKQIAEALPRLAKKR